MRQFIIEQSAAELTSQAGLGLIGRALSHHTDLATAATGVSPLRPNAVQHRDILASYIALQCVGKSDFEAITALANGLVPLDCDVSPFDNGRTHKEGVSRTTRRIRRRPRSTT